MRLASNSTSILLLALVTGCPTPPRIEVSGLAPPRDATGPLDAYPDRSGWEAVVRSHNRGYTRGSCADNLWRAARAWARSTGFAMVPLLPSGRRTESLMLHPSTDLGEQEVPPEVGVLVISPDDTLAYVAVFLFQRGTGRNRLQVHLRPRSGAAVVSAAAAEYYRLYDLVDELGQAILVCED